MDYHDIPIADAPVGSEGELLIFALDRVHRQFAWKSGGLTVEQLRQTHPPSRLTMAGLIKHLTGVEANWTAKAQGLPANYSPWPDVDWAGTPEWDFESAKTDDPDQLYATWYDTIARSRAAWLGLIEGDGLAVTVAWGDDYEVNRRRALVDILEENLLHTGHASMLRQAIDGLVGNDPP